MIGGGKEQLQFVLAGDGFRVRSATGATALWVDLFVTDKPQHLVANFDGRHMEIFIDGRSAGRKELKINLAGLAVDNFHFGDASGSLQARFSGIAIYDKELEQAEITANSRLAGARFAKEKTVASLVVEGTLQETTQIPAPDSIGAYRRALVVNSYAGGIIAGY